MDIQQLFTALQSAYASMQSLATNRDLIASQMDAAVKAKAVELEDTRKAYQKSLDVAQAEYLASAADVENYRRELNQILGAQPDPRFRKSA